MLFRGDVSSGEYVAFWMADRRVLAGMNVNVWDLTDTIAALVRSGAQVDTARLVNPKEPLSTVHTDALTGARS